jgi:hypothetical protein
MRATERNGLFASRLCHSGGGGVEPFWARYFNGSGAAPKLSRR